MEPCLLIKCLETKYVRRLLDYGELKFSSPRNWITDSKEGRGDIFEGAFVINSIFSMPVSYDYRCRSNVEHRNIDGFNIIRDKRVYDCYCSCFYVLDDTVTEEKKDLEGNTFHDVTIPQSYFDNFNDDNKSSVCLMPFGRFIDMLYGKLVKLGIDRKDIYFFKIQYVESNGYFVPVFPYELMFKRAKYSNQNEYRVMIDNSLHRYDKVMKNGIIQIGNLKDIVVVDDYHYKDMRFTIQGNLLQFEKAKGVVYELNNFYEIKALYLQAKHNDYVPKNKTPEERTKLMKELRSLAIKLGFNPNDLDE